MLQGFAGQLFAGTWITIKLAICAALASLLLGMLGAAGELTRHRALRWLTIAIVTILRGVPELLVIFLVYFGGMQLLSTITGHYVEIPSFTAGVVALGLVFGAYASQNFRSAFLAIPVGQIEAAQALGFNRWQTFWRIRLPQAWRYALPGLGNLWLVLLKDTSLVSLLGLVDLMTAAQNAVATTKQPFTFYLAAAGIYLFLTTVSQWIFDQIARITQPLDEDDEE